MHVAQRRFQKARHCIVRAQALRRGCVAQRRFQAQRNAATILQVCSLRSPGNQQRDVLHVDQQLCISAWPKIQIQMA